MTDNKFTDEEIVKSLELCFTPKGTTETCCKCSYHQFGKLCKVKRDRDVLDLIKRYEAEIVALKDTNEHLAVFVAEANEERDKAEAAYELLEIKGGMDREIMKRQSTEIDELREYMKDKFEKDLLESTKLREAEAVKEFAEKVDDMLWQIKVESLNKGEANKTCEIAHIRLQDLVSELEGEPNDT